MRRCPRCRSWSRPTTTRLATAVIESYERFDAPMYYAVGRPKTPIVYEEIPETLGTGVDVLRPGKDISIFVCGHMVWRGLEAAATLEREDGVEAESSNVSIIKPIDSQAVLRLCEDGRRRHRGGAPRRRRARRCDPPSRRSSIRSRSLRSGCRTSSASRARLRPAWSTWAHRQRDRRFRVCALIGSRSCTIRRSRAGPGPRRTGPPQVWVSGTPSSPDPSRSPGVP